MRWFFLVATVLCAWQLAGCASSHGGIYPGPVYILKMGSVTVPEGPLVAGDMVEFSADWLDGREPFQISWDFGGGADPALFAGALNERTHAMNVTLLNDTAGPVEYDASVVISDVHLREVRADFTFTVELAP